MALLERKANLDAPVRLIRRDLEANARPLDANDLPGFGEQAGDFRWKAADLAGDNSSGVC